MSGIMSLIGGGMKPLTLDLSNTAKPDVPARLSAAGWLGVVQPVRVVNTGMLNTLVFPSALTGADITLVNAAGALIGGAVYGGYDGSTPQAGVGGTALRTQIPIKLDNAGTIAGAGGGGGTGGGASCSYAGYGVIASGGVGGAGQGFDKALNILSVRSGEHGTTDSTSFPAAPGAPFSSIYASGGNGGPGGAWGAQGGTGSAGAAGPAGASSSVSPGFAGYLAGYYIDGIDLVTFINAGTLIGRVK